MKIITTLLSLGFIAAVVQAKINDVPTVQIAPGVFLPMVGLGTWLYNDSVANEAVTNALNIGYTHIDTAFNYKNADGVGQAIADYLKNPQGVAKTREDMFVTTKVMGGIKGGENLTMAELATKHIKSLQLSYVDLLLLHFPCAVSGTECTGGKTLRQQQWKSIETLVEQKLVRAIGVSHYCPHHLRDIFEVMSIKPSVNQVQYHVGMGLAPKNATDDPQFDRDHGILYQSFSPLCGPCTPEEHAELLTGKLVTSIGKKHGKSGAQVSLKWQVQQGVPVIPKSSSPKHLLENIELFDWELDHEDMHLLTAATTPPVSGGPNAGDSGDCGIN